MELGNEFIARFYSAYLKLWAALVRGVYNKKRILSSVEQANSSRH